MTCPICGREFVKTWHKQICCSVQCQVIRNEKKRAERNEKHRNTNQDLIRKDLVERIKAKYAKIDINEEIDLWLRVRN